MKEAKNSCFFFSMKTIISATKKKNPEKKNTCTNTRYVCSKYDSKIKIKSKSKREKKKTVFTLQTLMNHNNQTARVRAKGRSIVRNLLLVFMVQFYFFLFKKCREKIKVERRREERKNMCKCINTHKIKKNGIKQEKHTHVN